VRAEALAVELNLLRGFELRCDGESVELPLGAQRLVAFLALQDRRVLRVYVAGVLWLDASEERSHANLRSALWRLRRSEREVVTSTSRHLSLADGVDVDVRRAIATSREALHSPVGAAPQLVDDLGGELLPDWYEDWVDVERERLRQLRLHALEAVAERLLGERRFAQAADAGLTAIGSEPLRESAHRVLIRVHLAEDNPSEAVRQYNLYRQRLSSELGLEPSAQMRELVRHLLT
jgi:DNA-binding SARP family transcriptional activator